MMACSVRKRFHVWYGCHWTRCSIDIITAFFPLTARQKEQSDNNSMGG